MNGIWEPIIGAMVALATAGTAWLNFKVKDLDPDLFMVSVVINDDELFRLQEINKVIFIYNIILFYLGKLSLLYVKLFLFT